MELLVAHGKAMDEFDQVLHAVDAEQWHWPTPCAQWDVRTLANHLVAEQLWTPHLLNGATLAEVGNQFDGDMLGDAPLDVWNRAAQAARAAWLETGALDRTVHVTGGRIEATEYCWQMTLDLAVHAWDLATAIGRNQPIEDELAHRLIEEFGERRTAWQDTDIFDRPVPVPEDAGAPKKLVAMLGRNPY